MKKNIVNFLKNPKVQLAIFTLLAVIMAIGFFGNPNISGAGTAASTSQFLIATLSPMAAGFTLIPFIISIIGIGYSLMGIYKKNQEHKRGKEKKRFDFIEREKKELNAKYKDKLSELESEYEKNHVSLKDGQVNILKEIKRFINNLDLTETSQSNINKSCSTSPGRNDKYNFQQLIDNHGIRTEVDELRNIRKEIKVFELIEQKDLKKTISEIDKLIGPQETGKVGTEIKARAFSKLAGAKKENGRLVQPR